MISCHLKHQDLGFLQWEHYPILWVILGTCLGKVWPSCREDQGSTCPSTCAGLHTGSAPLQRLYVIWERACNSHERLACKLRLFLHLQRLLSCLSCIRWWSVRVAENASWSITHDMSWPPHALHAMLTIRRADASSFTPPAGRFP